MNEVSFEALKEILVQNCMLKIDPESITEETPLFGPDGIGLDSLDALQIVIAVEKKYGIVIGDPATAKDALQSLGVLHDWICKSLAVQKAAGNP
jgi:acyl carrier protein